MMKSYLKYLILYKHCSQCLLGFMSVFSNAVSKFYDLKVSDDTRVRRNRCSNLIEKYWLNMCVCVCCNVRPTIRKYKDIEITSLVKIHYSHINSVTEVSKIMCA